MKQKFTALLLLLILCLISALPAFAATGHPPRLVDNAGILTAAEAQTLQNELDEISERQQFDVVIVTVNSLEGKTATAFADDFFDYNGYGLGVDYDGALLLVCMGERAWAISTHGFGITALTDRGQEYITNDIVPMMSDGDFFQAFHMFGRYCDSFVTNAREGSPVDVGNLPRRSMTATDVLLAIAIGAVISLIVVMIMRGNLKSVRPQSGACSYVRDNSFRLTESNDIFLYRNVTRVARPKESSSSGGSSTHTSSSGRTHGGSSGRF